MADSTGVLVIISLSVSYGISVDVDVVMLLASYFGAGVFLL